MSDSELLGRELRVDELWTAFRCHLRDVAGHAAGAEASTGDTESARRRLHAARAALGAAERTLDAVEFGGPA